MTHHPFIKFQVSRTGHLIIKARINGRSIRLIVDTAAGTSVLDVAEAELLGLKERKNSQRNDVKGIGTSTHQMHFLIVPGIMLNGHEFKRPRFISLDLCHVKEAGGKRGMHGLLGSDFLKKHNALIDYKNRVITFQID